MEQESKSEKENIDIESYHINKSKKLLDESELTSQNRFNTYSQGLSYPLRFLWLHFLSMLKKLKEVEKLGRQIEVKDLPELEEKFRVEYTTEKLKKKIEAMNPETATVFQFFKMIVFTFKKSILGIIAYIFFENLTKLISPFLTSFLITSVKDGDLTSAAYWSFLLIGANFLGITLNQNGWTKAQRISGQIRLGLIYILYEKISNLSAYSVKKANIGKLINMISSDFNSFETKGIFIFHTLIAPITFVLSSCVIFYRLKWAGIVAIVLLLGLFPVQKRVAKKASEYTTLQTKDSDKKIKVFSEMMDGIRIIKMYGWELAFNQVINKWRHSEVKNNLVNQTIMFIEFSFSLVGPLFIALICFLIMDIQDPDYLDTALIFSTVELLNMISMTIVKNVGYGVSFIYDFKVLLNRYMGIIGIENVQMQNVNNLRSKIPNSPPSPNVLIQMTNFSAYWYTENLEKNPPVLSNINFTLKKGQTTSVIGSIGNGKTSFLFAIMQEIPRYKGSFYATSHIAFTEQEPYILEGSVRDNILFGKSYNEEFYQEVVTACCLIDDFVQFTNGDQTMLGERGTNLSGGQKARVCLARAVYANTDLYLLDDPLSAVDSKVAKKIFQNVIQGMLKDKGVILVTHQLNYALQCENILVFDNGEIIVQGNPKEIDFTASSISKFISALNPEGEGEKGSITKKQEEENPVEQEEKTFIVSSEREDTKAAENLIPKEKEISIKSRFAEQKESTLMRNNNQKEEEFPVNMKTYVKYLKINPSPWIFLLVIFTFVIQEFLFTGFYKTLSLYEFNISIEQFYPAAFGVLFSYFIFKFIQNTFMSYFILSTNEGITQSMVKSITHAKPVILDSIPSGQIINKFSNDINILDKQLPESSCTSLEGMLHFINLSGSIISINKVQIYSISLFLVIFSFQQYFLIPGSIEVYFFYKWFRYVKPTLMRAKQLDLENKTPVFQFFQSSLNGVLVINIFRQKQQFSKRMAILMNNSTRTYDIFWFITRLFSVYLQYMSLLTSAIGILMTLWLSSTDYGQFGQALAFFLLLTNFLQVSLRGLINMDTFMTSCERAFSILNLPKEAIDLKEEEDYYKGIHTKVNTPSPLKQTLQIRKRSNSLKTKQTENYNKLNDSQIQSEQSIKSPADNISIEIGNYNEKKVNQQFFDEWPNQGEIIFDNVFMKYKEELDYVLRGVSFVAKPLERVAIVGRTGAGKSSILQGLFRMSEIDSNSSSGKSQIIYDSIDTKTVSLLKLRKSISIIPQTPFVFSGSIKRNIDPLEEYDDENLNRVLEETGLNELIKKLPQGLDTDMSDSQSVFSMGQKQLVCLARVMLRNNKLIVLDEATANVDMETDQMIQELIKQKFNNCTIITIAHRLNTIADYDKVIVLEAGKVLEQGSPFSLLALSNDDTEITNKESSFAQMVLNTGSKNAEEIFKVCRSKFFEKKGNI